MKKIVILASVLLALVSSVFAQGDYEYRAWKAGAYDNVQPGEPAPRLNPGRGINLVIAPRVEVNGAGSFSSELAKSATNYLASLLRKYGYRTQNTVREDVTSREIDKIQDSGRYRKGGSAPRRGEYTAPNVALDVSVDVKRKWSTRDANDNLIGSVIADKLKRGARVDLGYRNQKRSIIATLIPNLTALEQNEVLELENESPIKVEAQKTTAESFWFRYGRYWTGGRSSLEKRDELDEEILIASAVFEGIERIPALIKRQDVIQPYEDRIGENEEVSSMPSSVRPDGPVVLPVARRSASMDTLDLWGVPDDILNCIEKDQEVLIPMLSLERSRRAESRTGVITKINKEKKTIEITWSSPFYYQDKQLIDDSRQIEVIGGSSSKPISKPYLLK